MFTLNAEVTGKEPDDIIDALFVMRKSLREGFHMGVNMDFRWAYRYTLSDGDLEAGDEEKDE